MNHKHLSYEYIFDNNLSETPSQLATWLSTSKISIQSLFTDNIWYLDDDTQRSPSKKVINWDKVKSNDTNIETMKRVLFFTKTNINGIKNYKTLTILSVFQNFGYLLKWMENKSLYNFSDITVQHLREYESHIENKQLTNGQKIKDTRAYYMPLKLMVEYANFIDDPLGIKEEDFKKIKLSPKSNNQTNPIPKHVLESLLPRFFHILNEIAGLSQLKIQEYFKSQLNIDKDHLHILNSICYFVVALYTGMRVSEIMSLKKSCIEISDDMVVLNGTLFKMTKTDSGKKVKWALGLNKPGNFALKAIRILENISPPEFESLFFLYDRNQFKPLKIEIINRHLNEMLKIFNVEEQIRTHQFRRTFAQLMGRVDKTNLLALQQHLKHISINMTSYYAGSDMELLEIIGTEKQNEIAQGLNEILSSNNLAGKLGEKIAKNNIKFRGKAGEQVRADYITSLMSESDLIIMPHEYGFCIYQPEQAQCKGESKNIGLNTCVKCNNFAVSERNKTFWLKRIDNYQTFSKEINNLDNQQATKLEIDEQIRVASEIISKIQVKQ